MYRRINKKIASANSISSSPNTEHRTPPIKELRKTIRKVEEIKPGGQEFGFIYEDVDSAIRKTRASKALGPDYPTLIFLEKEEI